MTSLHRHLAVNLKALRARYELTQAGLAEKSGLSAGFIGEIEVGHKYPSPEHLECLATALLTKPWQLLMDPVDRQAYQNYLDTYDLYTDIANKLGEKLTGQFDAYLSHLPRGPRSD